MSAREKISHFFDPLDGTDCEEWLGILEWAMVEEFRAQSGHARPRTRTFVASVLARMETHPDIEFIA